MSKAKVMKVLGLISIVLGAGLMVVASPFLFMAIGYMTFGGINHILRGGAAVAIYFFATAGFIISGIGICKQKIWGWILLLLLIVLWGCYRFIP